MVWTNTFQFLPGVVLQLRGSGGEEATDIEAKYPSYQENKLSAEPSSTALPPANHSSPHKPTDKPVLNPSGIDEYKHGLTVPKSHTHSTLSTARLGEHLVPSYQ